MGRAEIQEDEALRSDSEDDDYDDKVLAPRKRQSVKRSQRKQTKRRRSQRARGYDDDDDDSIIGTDEEDDLMGSGDDFSEDSADIERTATGRPKRAAVKVSTNFAESSEDDDDDDDDDDDNADSLDMRDNEDQQASPPSKASLVVKFPAFYDKKSGMVVTRGAARQSKRVSTRHSSRQSEERQKRSRTHSTESATRRPASKRVPGHPAIIEASQEDSQSQANRDEDIHFERGEDQPDTAVSQAFEAGDVDEDAFIAESQNSNPEAGSAPNEDNDEPMVDVLKSDIRQEDEDDDEEPPVRRKTKRTFEQTEEPADTLDRPPSRHAKRAKRGDESSDFDPAEAGEPEDDDDLESESGRPKASQASSNADGGRRNLRKRKSDRRNTDDDSSILDQEEMLDEARDLSRKSRRTRRQEAAITYESRERRPRGPAPDYRIFKPEALPVSDDDHPTQGASQRGRRNAGTSRSLLSTRGPFGGAIGPSLFGGAGTVGGADSDSSDDDTAPKVPRPMLGGIAQTPTAAAPPAGLFPQTLNADPVQGGNSGTPVALGKVKDKKALADADPLGVDQSVSFDGVGGLDNHINQLKEMVALPLLYPEVFQQFKITPPRGVLFHGPPGTGKTLLARALASSVSSQGRKVTFYMRKGADALSKWVGEAERQLRLLFEEARKNQPSIIFFDEIDGLAPVRSSKQEQIHASIVATLLALMDGMDGRGQVIVIGATNRPDSVDPALRRPGRFDREFYFPLPDNVGRRAILDIHTKGWSPPLQPKFKDQLAELTKGYGGADLRALCTEAALNAVQGTYPQIYKSNEKLVIDPTTIRIQPKDFMISINKMIPSSERTGGSGGAPIDRRVEPLLRKSLTEVSNLLDGMLPEQQKRTALEEAEYDDRDDEKGFEREMLQQEFDRARTFRPRLLIEGSRGMGQQYLGGAVLHKYERLHVQSFDLATLYNDATRTPEAAVVQLFNEVRRHKPGIIYLPNVNTWYDTVGSSVIKVFQSLLRGMPPNDPVLVLGIMELESKDDKPDENMMRDLFGFSGNNQYHIPRPGPEERKEFFEHVIEMIQSPPSELPGSENRPKRTLPQLEIAKEVPKVPEGPSRQELKARKKQDLHTLNLLKIQIQPIMDNINKKYRQFRFPVIDESRIGYLFEERDPAMVTTDIPDVQERPYEVDHDNKGIMGLRETATGKFYYNIETVTIERRLSNGYYKRPKDFFADIKRLAKDAKTSGNEVKMIKANELVANVDVDMQMIDISAANLVAACEDLYKRELERAKESVMPRRDHGQASDKEGDAMDPAAGTIMLGEPAPGRSHAPFATPTKPGSQGHLTNGDSSDSHGQPSSNGHADGDVVMGNSQAGAGAPGEHSNAETQRSQKSALTAMAQNSQPGDYHNSASTTSSGQKTNEKSSSSSLRWHSNTQSSNGVVKGVHPDLSELRDYSGQSQLPDTQGTPSERFSPADGPIVDDDDAEMQHSSSQERNAQSHAGPASATSLSNILHAADARPTFILDVGSIARLREQLVQRTSDCSIEQLEQVNAALMDTVWRHRESWNRDHVLTMVQEAFNAIIADIEQMQSITSSQTSGRSHDGVMHAA